MLRAAGMTQEQVADAVGCSVPTLAQYFSLELNEGKAAKRAEMTETLWNAAKGGNVTAMKAWLPLNDRDTSPKAIARPRPKPKLRKKEQALIDAKAPLMPTAGLTWSVIERHVEFRLR
jgi:transcriptional regulator with XRE-family HTH domain